MREEIHRNSPLTKGVKGVVIEIERESHEGRFSYDMQRQQFLESMGLTVIRFNDADVKADMNNVLMAIEGWIEEQPPCPPLF
jgi:very-short-patch-repair endonuclease